MSRRPITACLFAALVAGICFWFFFLNTHQPENLPDATGATDPPTADASTPPPQSTTVRVFGKVVRGSGDGGPVKDAAFYIITPGGDTLQLDARSDAAGAFAFSLTQRGVYSMYATDGKAWSFQHRDEMHRLETGPGIDSIGPLVLYLTPGATLEVSTRSAEGAPISDARVITADAQARTNAKGEARLILPPDKNLLQVRAEGYVALRRVVDLRNGQDLSLRLTLYPSGVLQGLVVDRGEAPLADVTVNADQTGMHFEAYSQEDGRFQLQGLQKGVPFTLSLTRQGYKPLTLTKQRITDTRDDRIITLHPLPTRQYTISGMVRQRGGNPLDAVLVTLMSTQGVTLETTTEEEGSFLFEDAPLAPGTHATLLVTRDGYAPRALPLIVDPATRDIDMLISMDPARMVQGVVVDGSGQAIDQARIDAYCKETNVPVTTVSTMTDHQGRFTLSGLNSQVGLEVRASGYFPLEHRLSPMEQNITLTLTQRRSITGYVTDPDEGPIPNFTIRLLTKPDGFGLEPADLASARVDTLVTSPEGRFALPLPREGFKHTWLFQADGYAPYRMSLESGDTEALVVMQKSDWTLETMIIPRKRQVQGVVFALSDPGPVPWDAYYEGGAPENILGRFPLRNSRKEDIFEVNGLPGELPLRMVIATPGYATVGLTDAALLRGQRTIIRDPNTADGSNDTRLFNFKQEAEKATLTDRPYVWSRLQQNKSHHVSVLLKPEAVLLCRVNPERFPGARWVTLTENQGQQYRRRLSLEGTDTVTFDGLMKGVYTVTIYGVDHSGTHGALAAKELTLEAGQTEAWDFGAEEADVLSGQAVVNGQGVAHALLVLKADPKYPPRETLTNGEGFFRFENLSQERISLVYLGNQPLDPKDLRRLKTRHPNYLDVDSGADQTLAFQPYGSISGRAAREADSRNLYLFGTALNHGTYYRTATLNPKGFFRFAEIPPGTYRISRSVSHGEPEVLMPEVHIGLGEHLDLGELISEDKGGLRLVFEEDVPANCLLNVVAYRGKEPIGEPLKERNFSAPEQEIYFDNLPAGPVNLLLQLKTCDLLLADERPRATIHPDQTTNLPVPFSRETALTLDFNIAQDARDSSGQHPNVPELLQLIHVASGKVVTFVYQAHLTNAPTLVQGQALMSSSKAWARGLLPGDWDLIADFPNVPRIELRIGLQPGRRTFLMLE